MDNKRHTFIDSMILLTPKKNKKQTNLLLSCLVDESKIPDVHMFLLKLQCMVSELKTGFTSALMELSQIQHGDTFLREELEENRRSCQKKALRLEALVESLRVRLHK